MIRNVGTLVSGASAGSGRIPLSSIIADSTRLPRGSGAHVDSRLSPPVAPRLSDGRGHILVIDDQPMSGKVIARLLQLDGHTVTVAADAEEGLRSIALSAPDVVLSDINMPSVSGIELCRRLKSDPVTRLLPVILITGMSDQDSKLAGIEAGADEFVAKPFNVVELSARVRALVRMKHRTDELESAEAVILYLAATVEARDPYTAGHCERLARYSVALGQRLGLRADDLAALHKGGYLHDIGKIAVPDAVLLKAGELEPAEYEQIKQHTAVGERLCGGLRSLAAVRPIVRHHHERFDGSGYPDGLAGGDIPLLAHVMAIVDIFDALTTARPYRPAWQIDHAVRELQRQTSERRFNPTLVEAFLSLPLDALAATQG